jgi:glycerophosphoryl diester phosphodiesterase
MRLSPFGLLDRWLSTAPGVSQAGWLRGWTYAHRGLHGPGAPENSTAAFAAAIARGMGIECDVQRSRDGQAVVFHDFTLERLTGESGPVARRSAAELGAIALAGGGGTIPDLRQLLAQTGGKVPLLIEVKTRKDTRIAAFCLAIRRQLEGYRGEHAVMSFDPRVSRWFARHSPLTLRGLVVTEQDDKALPGMIRRRLALWHARPHFLAYDIRDLPSRFAQAQRARGLPLLTWTVRTAELAQRAASHADAPIAEGAGVG